MIAITGGTGLLGAHLIYNLLKKGYKVKALRRPSSSLDMVKKVFSYYTGKADYYYKQIEWYSGDLNDMVSLEDFLRKDDMLFHCAGLVSFNKRQRRQLKKVNTAGTANISNAALNKGVAKLVYASSTSVLNRRDVSGIISESSQWEKGKGNSCYGTTKMLAEHEVWRAQAEGLSTAIVNPAIILGPGPWESGSPRLFTSMWNGLKFYTPGVNAFVDVRDVAEAMVALMFSGIEAERFVLAAGNMDYKTLFTLIAAAIDRPAPKYKTTKLMAEIAWRLQTPWALISSKTPMITRETARSAMEKNYYDGSKITKYINFNYRPLEQSIEEIGEFFKKDHA
ncbi:MAG: NAD-dependent epimerase/dehydratase family protein [Bacteroidales bacterium]